MIDEKTKERFQAKVNKRHWRQCWEWQAAKDSYGYGSFWFNGSAVMSHRIALAIKTGEMPEGMQACHSCNNPSCNNPHHLEWGTQEFNMQYMVACNRHKAGGKK